MTPYEFIDKWRAAELKERSASHEHFVDRRRLFGEPTPAEVDPTGETYCFERAPARKPAATAGADVWSVTAGGRGPAANRVLAQSDCSADPGAIRALPEEGGHR